MDEISTLDRASAVRALVAAGEAERLRKKYDGPRTAAAYRQGIDPVTLFRYEKGQSFPVGERLRMYHEYLTRLAVREAQGVEVAAEART